MGFTHIREAIERFLRIDSASSRATRIRMRMIYATGLIFLVIHSLNLISLTYAFGGWTSQHDVTVFAIMAILSITLMIRFTKSPTFFGVAFSILTVGGVGMAAIVPTVPGAPPNGITSSLIPILCSSAAFIALISTRLVSVVYILASAALIGFLYSITATTGGLTGLEAPLAWQRAVQGWIALFLIGPICTVISHLVFHNLAELEQAVTRAQEAEQARSNFMAKMSHEMRTPLHGIIGLSDMLARADLPQAESRQAQLISTSGHNLMEIMDEILDMAKLEDGAVTITAKPFSPHSLLQDIADLFAAKASGKGLWVGADTDSAIPETLIGDAPHLRQVISNLVGNAVKFTKDGGVRAGARLVALQENTAHVQFYVQDSGVGIPDQDQKDVFERFKQSDAAGSSHTKGTGLGLSICRELTEKMGGELELQSVLGQGSVFYFTLPFVLEKTSQDEVVAA
ncbi:MAG: ATP-binding protein [Pseudomonadota bacterium]